MTVALHGDRRGSAVVPHQGHICGLCELTGHDFDYALALSTGLSWVSAAGSFGASPVEVLVYRVGLNLSLITGSDPY